MAWVGGGLVSSDVPATAALRPRAASSVEMSSAMASRAVGEPKATEEWKRMGGSLMRASQRGRGRIRPVVERTRSSKSAGLAPRRGLVRSTLLDVALEEEVGVHAVRSLAGARIGGPGSARIASRSVARPRWSRDLAVPTGTPRMPAASVSGRSR